MDVVTVEARNGKQAGARRRQSTADSTATADDAKLPVPSSNVHLEQTFLGLIVDDPDLLRQARGRIRGPRVFYKEAHGRIWDAMCRIADRGGVPEVETLLDAAGDDTDLIIALNDIFAAGATLSTTQVKHREALLVDWAQQLAEHAGRRSLIDASYKAGLGAYPPTREDAEKPVATIFAELSEVIDTGWKIVTSADGGEDLFPILTDEEAEAMPPARGILGDILYENSLAILYGASGRWKSFLALSWALSIATGRDWLGRKVVEGDVVYIAAEGGLGIGKRITAWKRRHGISGRTRVHPLCVPVQLLDAEQVQLLIRSIRELVGMPVLIVVDTLSRTMAGGDENTGKDGSRAIQAADTLREAFGCTVLLVAHPGKDDGRGIRGWSGYFAAADTVMRVAASDNRPRLDIGDTVTLYSEKPKDSEPFADVALTTVKETWASADGAIVSSLVIQAAEQQPKTSESDLSERELEALRIVNDYAAGIGYNEWGRLASLSGGSHQRVKDKLRGRNYIEQTPNGNWHTTRKGAALFLPEQADTTNHYHGTTTVAAGTTTTTTNTLRGGSGGSASDAWEQPDADVAKWEGA